MDISKLGDKVADFAIPVIIVAALLGGVYSSTTGTAQEIANTILTGLNTAITSYWPLYVGLALLFGVYLLYKQSKHEGRS